MVSLATMPTAVPQPDLRPPARPQSRTQGARRREVAPLRRPAGPRAWLRAGRIRQWTKNLLVFGAPAAAGVLGRSVVLGHVALTFAVFCLLASGTYLINDVRDAQEDRRHPRKRHRPIASGAIPAGTAVRAGTTAIALGLVVALAVGAGVFVAACGYALLNAGYTTLLRRIAFADIAAVAGCFVIRAIAGAAAAGVPASRWFLVVVSFAALLVAAGKRYADFLDPAARRSRRVLQHYSGRVLRTIIAVTCAVALGAYCAWALGSAPATASMWRELTVIPFAAAVARYRRLAIKGRGGAPEQVLFGDRLMQINGAVWLVMFALGA